MAKTKSWHKKYISTKFRVMILGILLLGLLIAILQLNKTQNIFSKAMYVIDNKNQFVKKCSQLKGLCKSSCQSSVDEKGRKEVAVKGLCFSNRNTLCCVKTASPTCIYAAGHTNPSGCKCVTKTNFGDRRNSTYCTTKCINIVKVTPAPGIEEAPYRYVGRCK